MFRFQALGFKVQGSGFRVSGSGSRVESLGFRWGLGTGDRSTGFGLSDLVCSIV